MNLRACWDFAFGANAAKFYSEQGALREHSHSYVTEEQRSSGENLARTAQRVKSKQALRMPFLLCLLFLFLFANPNGFCQSWITGPYSDYPGPYHIRVAINFVQSPGSSWTDAYDLEAEAQACLATLNAA